MGYTRTFTPRAGIVGDSHRDSKRTACQVFSLLTQPEFAHLYRRAFKEYATRALWNKRVTEEPTQEDALVVARALRVGGNRAAR